VKSIQIGHAKVGSQNPCFIIAEAGVNHNGSLERALRLVDAAQRSGANCVKFQTFQAAELVTPNTPKARYQLTQTRGKNLQLAMLKKLELPREAFVKIKRYCERKKILFLSTPYGFADVDFLESLGVKAFKVASGQLVEPVFLKHIARKGKPMILSTGMATLREIDQAVSAVHQTGNKKIVLLQCTTEYPSQIGDANLRVISALRQRFAVPVGYSDHTTGFLASIVSVAAGAHLIEKHLTLDKNMSGPDHASSMNPSEFRELVHSVRQAELALGSSRKAPCPVERRNAKVMRRSVATAQIISKGLRIKESMLTLKRPGTGIPPRAWTQLLGRRSLREIPANVLLKTEWLSGKGLGS
jgi:N,N'-diacetyllegionaminate synthase